MSAASACDDIDRCPKPKDRCAQRDHCSDPPVKSERKVKKQRKKFAYFRITVTQQTCYGNRELQE